MITRKMQQPSTGIVQRASCDGWYGTCSHKVVVFMCITKMNSNIPDILLSDCMLYLRTVNDVQMQELPV